MNNRTRSRVIILLALLSIAGLLRFYHLGTWAFAGDETATLAEVEVLFEGKTAPEQSQKYRLPRVIPLSYLIQYFGHASFGRDEFGSRVMPALLGTLGVGVLYLLLEPLKGRPVAVAAALLVCFWPEHIFQSQQTRYYTSAILFSSIGMLLGGFVARHRSTTLGVAACCVIFAGILCHTLLAVLLGIVLIAVLAGSVAERNALPINVIITFLAAMGIFVLFYVVYLRPLVSGWNSMMSSGYDVSHSILSTVNMVGWPVALLAFLGFLLLCHERTAQNWYWLTCAMGCASTGIVFPLVLVAHVPAYMFPFVISILILAACAIGVIYELLCQRNPWLGAVWIGLACMGTLPSVASHYKDGSRPDIRTAANFVKSNWKPGDKVSSFSVGLFGQYARECVPAIPLSQSPLAAVRELQEVAHGTTRVWIVVQSSRGGLEEPIRHWLGTHCSHEAKVLRKRYDYAEYAVDVYLYSPAATDDSNADSANQVSMN